MSVMQESINKNFNHLKIHTQYSICQGTVKINDLKDFCKDNKIKPDFLKCDTEGHDYDIIKSIPFNKMQINELIFEWKHLDGFFKAEKKCEEILEHLANNKYKLDFLDDENIRAYKTDFSYSQNREQKF